MSNIPQDLQFARSHEWLQARWATGPSSSASATTRSTRWATWCSSSCRTSAAFSRRASACAVVESVKAASDVYAPLAGTVVAVNDQLRHTPELINADPYGGGWLVRLRPAAGGGAARS